MEIERKILTINGELLVARDQVHKKISELFESNEPLPYNFKNQLIFYAGPAPAPPGKIIGSIGPTTSARMESFIPMMLKLGVKGFIGKGNLKIETLNLIKSYGAKYFVTFGGYAALLSKKVVSQELIAYPEFGAEALIKIKVKDFPVFLPTLFKD